MKTMARVVYGVLGVLAIGLSVLVLFKPELALPPEAATPLAAHLMREQGAEGVFIGVMTLWCLLNFDRRRPVHLALVLFAGLFAAIHWHEYLHSRRQLASPLLNSLPFLVLAATTPFTGSRNEGSLPPC